MSKDPEYINPPCEACQAVELCQGRAATKCVRLMLRMGNWNLENFAKFWQDIDFDKDESIFPKCCVCQQPIKTKEDREFSENQAAHPGFLGELHPGCYGKVCQERPETPWEDPISGEVDWEEMEQDLGCEQPEDECGEDYY